MPLPEPPSAPNPPKSPQNANLWGRISEGRGIEELWSQFSADTRASYGFYGKELDWEEINKLPWWRRPLHIAKGLFLAMFYKLTPPRRIILLIAFFMLVSSGFKFDFADKTHLEIRFELFAALLFLLLLALELADKVTMKRDLEIAREIQQWLVPSTPPAVSNSEVAFSTRPQNSVAGDYYDAFYPQGNSEGNEKLFLVIADVAGKSIPAALLMATFQASLRTITGEGVGLNELVLRLNRYAAAHSLDGRRFTTALLAEYDPATRRLEYINAGHNNPILKRKDGTIERLETGGVPLGIAAESQFAIGSVDLGCGDLLLLFTDGMVDAFDRKGEEFGDARLVALVKSLNGQTAQQSMQFLMHQVDAFVGATRQFDDITCLVLRCR
ncbi:MAG: serine/threonine-protein phosphatase [Acidobacteria bacterium]|nr:serine/threonine-protein phosphatase [Acidobacteriota bacterium]MBS1864975.1 serine/threonine-protein phosphatase [Acidobacteriota bacterium]